MANGSYAGTRITDTPLDRARSTSTLSNPAHRNRINLTPASANASTTLDPRSSSTNAHTASHPFARDTVELSHRAATKEAFGSARAIVDRSYSRALNTRHVWASPSGTSRSLEDADARGDRGGREGTRARLMTSRGLDDEATVDAREARMHPSERASARVTLGITTTLVRLLFNPRKTRGEEARGHRP